MGQPITLVVLTNAVPWRAPCGLGSPSARWRDRAASAFRPCKSWGRRATGKRLDRVDGAERPPSPRRPRRTARAMEDTGLTVRRELQEASVLGESGAQALCDERPRRGMATVPSVRPMGRLWLRRGAWVDALASVAPLPRRAGLGPRLRKAARHSSASTPSRGWASRRARRWTSCLARCPAESQRPGPWRA